MEDYKLPPMTEAEIMKMEDDIFKRLCGNQLTGEVAAWLSILHSQVMRLNNRITDLEANQAK